MFLWNTSAFIGFIKYFYPSPIDIHWEKETKLPQGFQDMVNFKCGEKTCTISFPLTEKTNEKMIKCPLEVNLMNISSKKNMRQLFVYFSENSFLFYRTVELKPTFGNVWNVLWNWNKTIWPLERKLRKKFWELQSTF